jgi:hypothetical protein
MCDVWRLRLQTALRAVYTRRVRLRIALTIILRFSKESVDNLRRIYLKLLKSEV